MNLSNELNKETALSQEPQNPQQNLILPIMIELYYKIISKKLK
jgi:hypothetical protein